MYPREFCRAVCEGVAAEKRLRDLGMEAMGIMSLEQMKEVVKIAGGSEEYGNDPSGDLHEPEMSWDEKWEVAVDDQSGEPLEPRRVRSAQSEDI